MATILIIEDNDANRDILMRYLRLFGHNALLATDGVEGIELAKSARPDLILLDLSLPEIDGWQTAGKLKEMAETKAIPIIAVTAHAMLDDRDRALAAGCDDYEPKPIDLERLMRKVQSYLVRPDMLSYLAVG